MFFLFRVFINLFYNLKFRMLQITVAFINIIILLLVVILNGPGLKAFEPSFTKISKRLVNKPEAKSGAES